MIVRTLGYWLALAVLARPSILPPNAIGGQPQGASECHASEGTRTVTLNLRYRETPPTRVTAETPRAADVCFDHDANGQQFVGRLPVGRRLVTYTIIVERPDGQRLAISVEPAYRRDTLSLTLPDPLAIPCRPALVLEQANAQGRDATVAAAHQARRWYLATAGCPPSMKPVVAELWFNMSYRSVSREEALILDPDATLAFLRESPSRRTYVAGMLRRYETSQAGKRYHHQQALEGLGLDALQLNLAIQAAIRGDPLMAAIYAGAQVTLPALAGDFDRYLRAGRVSPALLAQLRQRTDPSLAIIPIANIQELAALAQR